MTDAAANPDPSPPLQWYQFRLRSLFVLMLIVAIGASIWASQETLRYDEYSRGNDAVVMSTSRFEIVAKGVGDIGHGTGTIQVGGFGAQSSDETMGAGNTVFRCSHQYSFGTLSFDVNGTQFSLCRHARHVLANGRDYAIYHRAIITIDQQGNITVEDRSPDDPATPGGKPP